MVPPLVQYPPISVAGLYFICLIVNSLTPRRGVIIVNGQYYLGDLVRWGEETSTASRQWCRCDMFWIISWDELRLHLQRDIFPRYSEVTVTELENLLRRDSWLQSRPSHSTAGCGTVRRRGKHSEINLVLMNVQECRVLLSIEALPKRCDVASMMSASLLAPSSKQAQRNQTSWERKGRWEGKERFEREGVSLLIPLSIVKLFALTSRFLKS